MSQFLKSTLYYSPCFFLENGLKSPQIFITFSDTILIKIFNYKQKFEHLRKIIIIIISLTSFVISYTMAGGPFL